MNKHLMALVLRKWLLGTMNHASIPILNLSIPSYKAMFNLTYLFWDGNFT